MDNYWAQTQEPKPKASKVPHFTIIARIASIVSLVVSLAILKSSNYADNRYASDHYYNIISSYQYMFACVLIGLVYNVAQTPFAAYYALRKKRLVNYSGFLLFEFFADKAIICVLGTAVGAAFGVTKDFKNTVDQSDSPHKSEFDDFFNMNYIASGFLFIGFICSIALSFFSSRPVSTEE